MIPLLQSKRILFFNVPLLLIGQNFLQNDTQNLCVLRPIRICTDFLLESIRPPVAAPESWSGDLRAALLTPRVAYEWHKPFGSFIPWFIFCECIVRNVTMASFLKNVKIITMWQSCTAALGDSPSQKEWTLSVRWCSHLAKGAGIRRFTWNGTKNCLKCRELFQYFLLNNSIFNI